MTISSTTRTAGPFTGTGVATVFPFAFKVFQAADLFVTTLNTTTGVQATLVLNTDFSGALNANQDSNPGGSITLTAGPLATGYSLTITSAMANLQLTEYLNQGGFYPEVLTASLDRATILIQQLQVAVTNVLSRMAVWPCVATTPGTVYTAPGNVAAAFINGVLLPPSAYTAVGAVITLNYTADPGDVVNALCTS